MKTAPLFTLDVDLGPMQDIGEGPNGYRRIIPITGGRFEGRISGDILPGGADWNLVRPDGTVHLWARYTLRADDGALIMITNEGFQPGDPETMDLILSGHRMARMSSSRISAAVPGNDASPASLSRVR